MTFWFLLVVALILAYNAKKKSSNFMGQKLPPLYQDKKLRIKKASSNRVSHRFEDDDDDGFATFTVSYGYDEPKSKNKKPGKWIAPGETIEVKGHRITKGYFYYGGRLPSLDNYGTDASLVDDTLKVRDQDNTYEDESLGYWPKYIKLSASGKGAYLNWLASNRDDSATPVGYVFIYFYGLERRVLVDSIKGDVEDSEFKGIFDEVIRLKETFSDSRSFLNYSTKLLEIMCLLRQGVVYHPGLEKNPKQDSVLLKYRLAKTVGSDEPIPSNLALAWLKFIPEYSLRKPARRCAFEFGEIFIRLYEEKYRDGLKVKPNKTRLMIDYQPGSSSLQGVKIPCENLPDPSKLKGPTKKLIALAEECTDALDAYSRYLGRAGNSRTDVAAILLLPDVLNDLGETLGLGEFKRWAEKTIATKGGLADFHEFWKFTKTALPEKINKKESVLIQSLAEKTGFGVAPDTRFHHAKPSVDGKIVLFHGGHGQYFEPSKAFSETGMALRLGSMVATIDGDVDEAESVLLRQLIDHDTSLSPAEKRSLHAYLTWRLNSPSNIAGLKCRLENLREKEKSAVSKILIGVALADGQLDPGEIKQLEKLYKILGLDKSFVSADIHSFTTNDILSPSTRQPNKTEISSSELSQDLILDESLIALHESQTRDAQSMLSTIFVDEEPIDETPNINIDDAAEEDMGIDSQHYALYEKLINKDRWPRKEMDDLCRQLGLMASGAIETINDWAFERVDAAVLEEEADSVFIDQDIVEELEG